MDRCIHITKIYYNEDRICRQFYKNYFPIKACVGYKNFYDILNHNIEQINKGLYARQTKRGGEFVGCYMDDYERKRPRTSPVYYETCYNKIEQLRNALELALEDKLIKLQESKEIS